jgi:hypothetical protein
MKIRYECRVFRENIFFPMMSASASGRADTINAISATAANAALELRSETFSGHSTIVYGDKEVSVIRYSASECPRRPRGDALQAEFRDVPQSSLAKSFAMELHGEFATASMRASASAYRRGAALRRVARSARTEGNALEGEEGFSELLPPANVRVTIS